MLLQRQGQDPMTQVANVIDTESLLQLRQTVANTHISEEVADYIVRLVSATRNNEKLLRGASPRATLSVAALSKAFAQLQGRDYVIPRDVQEVFPQTIAHRVQVAPGYDGSVSELLSTIVRKTKAPRLH